MAPKHVAILGGGLAGLACAYEMSKSGLRVTVIEREPQVGGMASSFEEGDRETAGRTDSNYWSHDFGPHRFHSDETELMNHVVEILGDNAVWSERRSRILMSGRLFDYPLQLPNVLRNMPPLRIARMLLDYAWTRVVDTLGLRDYRDRNFKEWVERRFGRSLADLFFIQYTEKAWGIPATEISSVWASQRITLLSLADTIVKTVFRPRNAPRTLVTEFVYPKLGGIGELSRGYQRRIEELGGTVLTDTPALRVHRDGTRVTRVEYRKDGASYFVDADAFISTIPITDLARRVEPRAPAEVRQAINRLGYVSIVFVYLKIDRERVTDDNWVYLPEKQFTVHRISEFKNFSATAGPAGKTMLCAEITCRAGDAIWSADEDELEARAVQDLAAAGFISPEDVLGSFVKRIPFAYPLYDLEYQENLTPVMEFVHALENLETGGRQGLFRYNNMDQSIEMGRLMAARMLGETGSDHESVATEQRYFG